MTMRHSTRALLVPLLLLGACGGSDSDTPVTSTGSGKPKPPPLATAANPPAPQPRAVNADALDLPPGERADLDGIPGFSTVSAFEYDNRRGVMWRFDVTHVFPQRARWSQEINGQPELGQIIEYRYGGQAYRKEKDHPISTELTGESRLGTLRLMDMREAVFMWPHGFDWKDLDGQKNVRVAELDYGSLVATLENGQLKKVETRSQQGTREASLEIDTWQETEGRRIPQQIFFMDGDTIIWRERVISMQTRINLKDTFFLPVDYLEVRLSGTNTVQLTAIPGVEFQRFELGDDADWGTASEHDAQHRAEHAGAGLSSRRTYELGAGGQPIAVVLRRDEAAEAAAAPSNWESHEPRMAATLFVNTLDEVPDKLAELSAKVPQGASAGTPYATFDPEGDAAGWVQLVLPYEP